MRGLSGRCGYLGGSAARKALWIANMSRWSTAVASLSGSRSCCSPPLRFGHSLCGARTRACWHKQPAHMLAHHARNCKLLRKHARTHAHAHAHAHGTVTLPCRARTGSKSPGRGQPHCPHEPTAFPPACQHAHFVSFLQQRARLLHADTHVQGWGPGPAAARLHTPKLRSRPQVRCPRRQW